ncbi:MAG TPA: hypothetical protein PKB14_19315 [Rubrivivax sp.]|nr:hypothetical protein [Rubrivivax sp.]
MTADREDQLRARLAERVSQRAPRLKADDAWLVAGFERMDLVRAVNKNLDLYRHERNGLAVWRAIRICHKYGEPLPANIVAKLAQWGEALEKAATPREIARALDLAGRDRGHKGRRRLDAADRRLEIASAVRNYMDRAGVNATAAIAWYAKNAKPALSVPAVKKHYYAIFGRQR